MSISPRFTSSMPRISRCKAHLEDPTVQAPNIGGLTEANNTAGAAAQQAGLPKQGSGNAQPSIIIVEVLGFGGGSGEEKPDSEQQRNRGKQSRLNYDSDSTVRVLGNGPISSEQTNALTTEENELLAAGERHRVVSVR